MPACPSCGESNPDHARFCLACGTPLGSEGRAHRQTRKTVTLVFCDLIDSTPLGEQLEAETYRQVISRYFIEVSGVLERHGGTVEKFIGDAVMAVFGIPTLHEDDALRAVRSAVELREAIGALNEDLRREYGIELGLRTGINTGEVIAGDPTRGQAFATGDAVAVAQRLEAASSPGEILMGHSTQQLVRDAVLVEPVEPLELKGKSQPVKAWRVLGVVSGAPAFARRLDSPLVGRQRELALLEQAFRRAEEEPGCHMFTVLGAAGVGKSRLVNELLTSLGGEAHVLVGRCVPYGEGITFWPLTELVRQAAGIGPTLPPEEAQARIAELVASDSEADAIVQHLAAATGLSDRQAGNEEIFWAVRKLLETVAQERPVIVAFDDLQWAEPTFLDLVDHLSEWTRNAPVLLVGLARPELLDDRPNWGGGKMNATSILLEPLKDTAVGQLVANLLGAGDVAGEIHRTLHVAGEGNPLFVEEMLAMLVDQGRLEQEETGWTVRGELGPLAAPPTIQALLSARIDRLDPPERALLELASVIGRLFSRDAVAALSPEKTGVDQKLASLVRKDLIRPDRHRDDSFHFRHILVRDAAYQGMAKQQRAELHERFAGWLEEVRPGRLREYEEILGYHLEQAHRHRAELAPADERTQALATRAAELLASAGRRAQGRGDMSAAVGLLTRATLLLRDDTSGRLKLAPALGGALMEIGELVRAEGVLSRAMEEATAAGARDIALHARLLLALVEMRIDPSRGAEEIGRVAEEGIEVFEELGDEAGLADAWNMLSHVHWMRSQWSRRRDALEHALVHARRAGDRHREGQMLGALTVSLLWGSTPVPEAVRRCEEFVAQLEGDSVLEARVTIVVAELEARRGNFERAHDLYTRGQGLLEELGLLLYVAIYTQSGGAIWMLAGDYESAERELRRGYEILRRMGEKASLSTCAALLSRALCEQGRFDDSDRFAAASATAAAAEDWTTHVILESTRARVLAHRGEYEAAEERARHAVSLAERTDALVLHGDALADLAEVLRLAGREREAAEALDQALELYDQKGSTVSRERAQRALAALAATR
jgi:class 3 adenylate cyclase/tetratricopeptide (TPR) repeat protein